MSMSGSDPSIAQYQLTSARLAIFWTGLYGWEVLTSLEYEIDFISGKRVFHWHLVPYLISRYSQMIGLLCLLYTLSSRSTPVNCASVYVLFFSVELSVLAASVILALRTMAAWTNRAVTIGLLTMVAIDAALVVMNSVLNESTFQSGFCINTHPLRAYTTVTVMRTYIMFFDAVVLILNIYKLGLGFRAGHGRGQLVRLLLEQGMIYFIIAFLLNAAAVILLVSTENHFIGLLVTTPASLLTVIAACRCTRSLTKFMARSNQSRFSSQVAATATGPVHFLESRKSFEERMK
ncbi:hypothetical protein CPB83DRAFT_864945 [Crepidotus variabilis]|uniref:Transmembrane protein n=1 Tax=Crepidotus variabilis TaxID=179855 RepID=A0A9P6E3Z1_9AGAR|nr:hypothetical protein CPB83DRAFT_864945 [Crepidotus variabilis]